MVDEKESSLNYNSMFAEKQKIVIKNSQEVSDNNKISAIEIREFLLLIRRRRLIFKIGLEIRV